jgi:hypothetical protein
MSDDAEGYLEDGHTSPRPSPVPGGRLRIISYGHSKGRLTVPAGAEQLTFSVRDIENPPARLRRTHTGLSPRLRKEVMANKSATTRLESMCSAVEAKMSDLASADGSCVLFVGIMCEEGKHRSVTFAEELSRRIAPGSWLIDVSHRDLGIVDDEDGAGEGTVDSDEAKLPSSDNSRVGLRKGKKQRDQERKKGRSSASKFVSGGTEEYNDVD